MSWIYISIVSLCTLLVLSGIFSSYWLLKFRKPATFPDENRPPVSIIKPLKGVDDSILENLESFANQTYPNYEILFGVDDPNDPIVEVVEQFILDHPDLSCKLVIHDGDFGLHPKIANIRGILAQGSHDIIISTDADVRVPPDYIEKMTARLLMSNMGLVTSFFIGVQERNLGALLENMGINGTNLNQVALFRGLFGEALVIGKSIGIHRSKFEELGGFSSLSYVLAEDYLMGKMIKRGGYQMDFCTNYVHMIKRKASVADVWRRYLRWSIQRSHVAPLLYPFELFTSPFFIGLLAPLFGVNWLWGVLWMLSLLTLRDLTQWLLVRGTKNLHWVLLLNPFRELLFHTAWICAPFFSYVHWRGQKLHIGEGTHLFVKLDRKRS